ncbi:urea amidolyase family protein [Acinetobacter sp. VNH17]|uniref:Urea amidolyase family protein n=1 Tax=Acinetobacter thutiue TaxID=2998078 RepID=A0ABT7WLW5_9GAMM|nr:urea amidolyase family protein [Acinetobacter thutiue]MCY6411538.1 urea amidolyase family protein [Acinetobacter thutiue]MDN0013640.1 urea amidolyase family protein [Acinetobacter thutiue]
MRFLSVNLNCFLIEFSSLEETVAAHHFLQHAQHPHIQEMIPAARTILVYFDDLCTDAKALIQWISAQKIDQDFFNSGKEVVINVRYDGIDLAHVAEYLGIAIDEVIQKHTDSRWQVAFIGFAPGFAYLISPDHPFGSIPRLASPRKKICAGSVGLAGEYSGIYPKDSPGGWQLIGQTDEKMWDLHRQQPALLLPSDQVVFNNTTQNPVQITVPSTRFIANQSVEKTAILKVKSVGLQVLIQDQGRRNVASLGVGQAGAMDRTAYVSANQIVGNPRHAAVLEILNGGLRLQVLQSTVIAVTGAQAELWIHYASAHQVKENLYQPIALDQDDEVYISSPQAGVRNYLAIRGGIMVEQVLGSASYDSLAELGTPPIKMGNELYSAQLKTWPVDLNQLPVSLPKAGDQVIVDIVLGPRTDWFTQDSLALLWEQSWLVTTESNRIGLRLFGDQPLQRQLHQELPSEGCCTGALQVPANGQPVLFMNDHPLTGGYPVIATVAPYHLDLIAQLPAGCSIQFRPISDFMDINHNESAT